MAVTKKKTQHVDIDDEEGGIGEWYAEHSTAINWILLIALVAILGWRAVGWWQQTQLESASNAYSPVQRDYSTALAEQDAAKREKSLSDLAAKGEAVSSDFAGKPVGLEAQLLAANALYYQALPKTGNEAVEGFKKARASYEKYIAAAPTDQQRAIGQLGLANTLENLFFLTREPQTGVEATDAYKKVAELAPNSYLAGEAKLSQARLLQAQKGRQEEAQKLYQEVAENRQVPPPSDQDSITTQSTAQGQVLTPEQVAGIRTFREFSYQAQAEKAQQQLPGLPTTTAKQ